MGDEVSLPLFFSQAAAYWELLKEESCIVALVQCCLVLIKGNRRPSKG